MIERFDEVTVCHTRRVTFSEVDAVGFVHHSHVVVWSEVAREMYFRKFGVLFREFAERGEFLAVREINFRYDAFIAYDDPVEIRCALTRLGRVNLDLCYRIDNRRTEKTAIVGWSNMVIVEQKKGLGGGVPTLGRLPDREAFLPRVMDKEAFYAHPLPPLHRGAVSTAASPTLDLNGKPHP